MILTRNDEELLVKALGLFVNASNPEVGKPFSISLKDGEHAKILKGRLEESLIVNDYDLQVLQTRFSTSYERLERLRGPWRSIRPLRQQINNLNHLGDELEDLDDELVRLLVSLEELIKFELMELKNRLHVYYEAFKAFTEVREEKQWKYEM